MKAKEEICLTHDNRVVAATDEDAAYLLVAAGGEITDEMAKKYDLSGSALVEGTAGAESEAAQDSFRADESSADGPASSEGNPDEQPKTLTTSGDNQATSQSGAASGTKTTASKSSADSKATATAKSKSR